jgi:co-chaperonin GroES (HSP10)
MTKRYSKQVEPLDCYSHQFKPLGSQFLGRLERKDRTDGGIILANDETTWWVDVVAVGPDCDFGVGDMVLVEEFRGENIDLADGEFSFFDQSHTLAVAEQ